VPKDSLISGDWVAPLDAGAAPPKVVARARTTGVGAVRSGGKVKVPPLVNVSKTDVAAMLLAATDSEIAASISAFAADANPVDSTRAVTYR